MAITYDRTPPLTESKPKSLSKFDQLTSAEASVGRDLLTPHVIHLRESAISDETISARGYFSVLTIGGLRELGFADSQWSGPGIIIPVHPPGTTTPSHYVYRPDDPRDPKRKYLNPIGRPMRLDVPPQCQSAIGDPSVTLWITEGSKKADALASKGECAIALMGVWCWKGTNDVGGKTSLPDWDSVGLNGRSIVVAFDSDASRKPSVLHALTRLTGMLRSKGAIVRWVVLPDDADKIGVDDFLHDHTMDDLHALIINAPEPPNLPKFKAKNPKIREQVQDLWSSLLAAGAPFYVYNDFLVYLDYTSEGNLRMRPVDQVAMSYYLSGYVTFVDSRVRNGAAGPEVVEIEHSPPRQIAETMARVIDPQVPVISSIVRTPRFRSDGSLITEPGFDPGTKLFYDPSIRLNAVPDNPTSADVEAAKDLIFNQMLSDFEFDEEADLAHAVALAIEPFVRPMIGPKMPIHLIEAAIQGTGKGLLADVLTYPAHGAWISWTSEPESDAEVRKKITASLLANDTIFGIDNVKNVLSSGSLAAAVTTETWRDRLLGSPKNVSGQITWSWVITANNPTVDSDISRRVVRTRLVASVEDPSQREDFRIPDLKKWVVDHEAEILHALLTLVQSWVKRGMPQGSKPMGSFESWARTLGGILETAGIPGFLSQTDEPVDPVKEAWRSLVEAWRSTYAFAFVTVAQLYDLSVEKAIELPLSGKDENALRRSLGMKLRYQKDRVYGSLRIVQGSGGSGGVNSWVLQDTQAGRHVRSVKSVSCPYPQPEEKTKKERARHGGDTPDTRDTTPTRFEAMIL